MKVRLKRILETIGLRPRTPPSRVFVSVNVTHPMRPPGFSKRSTKVIARISMWTLVILVLMFLIIYTILLAYVDNRLRPSERMNAAGLYRKVKLQGKFRFQQGAQYQIITNLKNNNKGNSSNKTVPRKRLWNPGIYYRDDVSLPQCRWQTIFRVLITSSPEHIDRRAAIRNTWCDPKAFKMPLHSWHCIFLVGQAENENLRLRIQEESDRFNDMLLGSYIDSYRNLTLKVIHGFNWSINFCPSSFVIKTDDDCFVNAHLLYDFLLHTNRITSNLYAGNVVLDQDKLVVVRGQRNKWSVSYDEYPDYYYPPYASGIGYVLSTDVARKLVSESPFVRPIPNEDAYVGIVMARLRVKPTRSGRFVISSGALSYCNFLYVFMAHDVQSFKHASMMEKAVNAKRNCHKESPTTWN